MNLKIEIQLLPDLDTSTYALALVVLFEGESGWEADPSSEPMVLQSGYKSPAQALAAVYQCLTFAPPDMAPLEEGLAQVSGLMDRMTEVEGAITTVGERLNVAEDTLEQLAPPAPAGNRSLLPPRPGATAAAMRLANRAPAQAAPPPAIRQPSKVISAVHRSHGGLPITAGVGRPGQLAPTGVTGEDSSG